VDDWKEFAAKHPECLEVSNILESSLWFSRLLIFRWSGSDNLRLSICLQSVAVSTGTSEGDFERLGAIVTAVPQIQYICVDVANGYSEHFVNFVKDVRQMFTTHTIMVSYLSTSTTFKHFVCIILLAIILIFWNPFVFCRLAMWSLERWLKSWFLLVLTSSKWALDQVTSSVTYW